MDTCTHEVRLAQWTQIIQQCQNRPQGQSDGLMLYLF